MLLRTLCTLVCTMAAGCLDEAPTSASSEKLPARELFSQRAWPALGACTGCHATQAAIDFLAPGNPDGAYQTIFAYQPSLIDLGAPASSLLVTMGKHSGPAFTPVAATQVVEWMQAEREERVTGGSTLRVGPFLPAHGTPIVLQLGVGGATLTIVTEATDIGVYAKRITVAAGTGVKLSHPLFVSRPVDPILDDIDRFNALELSLKAGETAEIGPAWFLPFSPTDYLQINFSTLEAPQ